MLHQLERHMTTELLKDIDTKKKVEQPPKFVIVLHNDSSTPFPIVIHVLTDHLGLCRDAAAKTMMEAHTAGKAVCGVWPTKDLAETRLAEAMNCYAVQGTELTLTVEPE